MNDPLRTDEHVWITYGGEVFRERPKTIQAVEYMRVLSRQEVEKIAGDGIDVQQYLNSLLRQIDGQRREINRLKETLAVRDRENGALAEGYLAKLGIKPEDLR